MRVRDGNTIVLVGYWNTRDQAREAARQLNQEEMPGCREKDHEEEVSDATDEVGGVDSAPREQELARGRAIRRLGHSSGVAKSTRRAFGLAHSSTKAHGLPVAVM